MRFAGIAQPLQPFTIQFAIAQLSPGNRLERPIRRCHEGFSFVSLALRRERGAKQCLRLRDAPVTRG